MKLISFASLEEHFGNKIFSYHNVYINKLSRVSFLLLLSSTSKRGLFWSLRTFLVGENDLFSLVQKLPAHVCQSWDFDRKTALARLPNANGRKWHGINKEMQFASNQHREAAKTRYVLLEVTRKPANRPS